MQSLTISLIQTRLFWEDKQKNLEAFTEKINALKGKTEVVVLPEMFTTGFSMNAIELAETMAGPSVQWMQETSAANKLVITGSLIIEEKGNFYNRMIWMLPDGTFGVYDKRHLFAFAGENKNYTAGQKRLIASVKGFKINLQVCYDLRFPVWARQTPSPSEKGGWGPEYDLLIYVANWPEKRKHAWKTLLMARAIENQCYVIGVNRVGNDGNDIVYVGDSMVVDPLGEILYHKEQMEDVFTITLQKDLLQSIGQKFPFLQDRDTFTIQ
ncbi:MAG: nitrilase family protein [Ferruginibacter sp.]